MPIPTGVRSAALKTSKTLRTPSNHSLDHPDGRDLPVRRQSSDRKPSITVMDLFRKDHGKEKEKRNSLSLGIGSPKSSPKNSPSLGPAKPAKMAIDMESPPLVMYGSTAQSSGALMSGNILLTVTDPKITLDTLDMHLQARTTFKRPIHKDCRACTTKDTTVFSWKFLTEPKDFTKDMHSFPFSYLLPGHLPASTDNHLGKIEYVLEARGVTSLSDTIVMSRTLKVQRALMSTGDKTSVRIFPPTNLSVRVVHPAIIHPIGEFPVQMALTGVIDRSLKNIERRWRIRRINWRIEEKSKIISAPCTKHVSKLGENKGILHEEVRELAKDDMKSGWKTDFDTEGGSIEFEFSPAIKPNSNSSCDVASPAGFEVSHKLALELVVAEEQTAGVGKDRAAPTGSARVLRMEFKLSLTERGGMGISWDEEMPPMYEDVPNSPPGYMTMHNYEGDLEDVELDQMHQ